MTGFQGTEWVRHSDKRHIVIVEDKQANSRSRSRPLRIKDLDTGKHHWTSPDRLIRKHEPTWGGAAVHVYPEPSEGTTQ